MDDPKDARIGTVLEGRYRILERIAAGGMGVVYRGERVQLGRPVAIKILHQWVAGHPDMLKRFDLEARAMSRLSHPSCVAVLDFGVDRGVPYLVMDYVTGRTLRSLLEAEGALPLAKAVAIARPLLAGLAHAHGQGIIHRDIKPDNIVVGEMTGLGTQVRILDFGIAKLRDIQSELTLGFALGTPSYMAPEQSLGEPVDARTDVYSSGVVVFEMLTGRKPFVASEAADILRLHRETPAPRLSQAAPEGQFSRALEATIARALAKAPSARYPTAEDFAEALERAPEVTQPRLAVPPPPVLRDDAALAPTVDARPRRSPRARRLPRWALLVVAAAAASAVYVFRRSAPPPAPAAAPTGEPRRAHRARESKVESTRPPLPTTAPPPAEADRHDDDDANADERAPAPSSKKAAPPAPKVPGLAEARRLAASGRWNAAVEALRKLRKKYPKNAEVAFLLGGLYLDRLWGDVGIDAYRAAVRLDASYRTNPIVIKKAVATLVSDRHGARAMRFIRDDLGEAAVPELKRAKKSHSLNVQRRADQLLRTLDH